MYVMLYRIILHMDSKFECRHTHICFKIASPNDILHFSYSSTVKIAHEFSLTLFIYSYNYVLNIPKFQNTIKHVKTTTS